MKATVVALLALLLVPASAIAKRKAPSPVAPVVWQGVEYRAPLDVEHMGRVQAYDQRSGSMLWETKVYRVWINPLLEEDVQWVFISGMRIEGGKLVVRNEKGKTYRVDVGSGRVEGAVGYGLVFLLGGVCVVVVGVFVLRRAVRRRRMGAEGGG